MKYALIKNGVVINVVKAETSVLDAWVTSGAIDSYAVATDLVVNIGDSYSGGVFVKPSLTLAQAKLKKLSEFKAAVDVYLDEHYPFTTRTQLVNLYILARLDSLTNRAAYLLPGVTWLNTIIEYSAAFATSVQSGVDVNTVLNMTWDLDSNVGVDPKLTLAAAIVIED